MKTVINALQYKPDSSGIGVMIRELFGAYADVTKRPCTVILSGDSPGFPAGKNTEIIRSPWSHGQSVRRMIFQTFLMGRKYCREAVLLTNDSGTPFFLPGTCRLVPVITDLAVYRLPDVYQQSSGGECGTVTSGAGPVCLLLSQSLRNRRSSKY